jgi:hypothetical protein
LKYQKVARSHVDTPWEVKQREAEMDRDDNETELRAEEVVKRLEGHPIVKARLMKLLDLMENTGGDLRRADDAERRAIDELRAMGQEVLQDWGQRLADKEAQRMARHAGVVRQVKKTSLAQHLR